MTQRALLAALLVVMPLQGLDQQVRHEVQDARQPWLEAPMRFASTSGRPLIVGGAVIALFAGAAGRALVGELAVALVPVNLVVEATKLATDRGRPDGTHRRSNAAFPSSHAANAFAVAMVLARRHRSTAWVAFPYAAFVAASRVYLDRHWLTDVVAGALVGTLVAWWSVTAWRAWRRARAARQAAGTSARGA